MDPAADVEVDGVTHAATQAVTCLPIVEEPGPLPPLHHHLLHLAISREDVVEDPGNVTMHSVDIDIDSPCYWDCVCVVLRKGGFYNKSGRAGFSDAPREGGMVEQAAMLCLHAHDD